MKHPLCTLLVLGIGLLAPHPAWADPKDDARRHFAAGLEAARAGDYEEALLRFLAAQDAYPHPATLYNIARAYSDLEDWENALRYYREYQAAAPEKASSVETTIAELEKRLQPEPPPAPPPSPPTPPTDPEATARLRDIAATLEELSAELLAISPRAAVPPAGATGAEGSSAEAPSPDAGAPPVAAPDEAPTEPSDEAPTEPVTRPGTVDEGFLSSAYERLVVTASRVGQDPLDSPSTLTVVTAEDIRLSGALTLPDVLRRVVGVDVMSLTSGHRDLSIRGFNRKLSNKVLVLIDGRSTYLDFLGATLWSALPITVDAIDRIEVIRGPGSAVYGANAVTGVINIITRAPGETPRTVFRGVGGTVGLARFSAATNGQSGSTRFRIDAGVEQMGRWARSFDPGDGASPMESPLLPDPHTGLRVVRGSARVDRTFGESGLLSLQGGMTRVDVLEFANIGVLGDFVSADQRHHFLRADATYGTVHARVFWNHDQGWTGPVAWPVGGRDLNAAFRTDTLDAEIETPYRFETGPLQHVLNLGLGYRKLDVRFGYLAGGFDQLYVQHHLRGFLNEELSMGRFKAVGSLRIDKHPLLALEETISPRGAVIVRILEHTSVRATAGTAFRQPNNVESYMDFDLPTMADGAYVRDLGNTELKPERITTFELGLHDRSSYLHEADVVVFYNQVRNLIGLDALTPAIAPFDPVDNGYLAGTTGWVQLAEIYDAVGLEAELETYPVDGLDLFANLSVTSIQERTPDRASVPDRSASLLKVNLGASYRTPIRLDLSVNLHYLSPQTWRLRGFDARGNLVRTEASIPARTLLSARVAGRPFPEERLELAAGIWNALGGGPIERRFREHPSGQPIRDVIYGEISYAF